MSAIYEMVDSSSSTITTTTPTGGRLELMLEDNVYHPDQSVRSIDNLGSSRLLDPIFADNPIDIRTVFCDPRCTNRQRIICFGSLFISCLICISILISLFVGFGRVLAEIGEMERIAERGLYMIPDLRKSGDTTLFFSRSPIDEQYRNEYIREIDEYLKNYEETQQNRTHLMNDCEDDVIKQKKLPIDKFCRFNIARLGGECTRNNNYGYDVGRPCVLFALRNIFDWKPIFSSNASSPLLLPFSCRAELPHYSIPMHLNISYYPSTTNNGNNGGGFDLKLIPTRSLNNAISADIESDIYDLPSLVMVQLIEPPNLQQFSIECRIKDKSANNDIIIENLHELVAIKSITFDLVPIEKMAIHDFDD